MSQACHHLHVLEQVPKNDHEQLFIIIFMIWRKCPKTIMNIIVVQHHFVSFACVKEDDKLGSSSSSCFGEGAQR
jgi:hypothetical protein